MTLDETIKRYADNAEYERTHGNLQGCMDFKQLVEWLKELKQYREQKPCEDAVSRKWLVEALEAKGFNLTEADYNKMIHLIRDTAPTVQPKYNTSEWCHDCKEYNHDKHCCPRFNKVIRNTVEEMKQPCEDKIIEWKKDFKEYVNSLSMPRDDYKGIIEYIDELPVTSEPCEDAISRKAILECQYTIEESETLGISTRNIVNVDDILNAKSVQPKYNTSEWCHDCSEYNHDKHCCPRYNKVIRNTVEEMKEPRTGHWISYWDEEARCYVYKCPECGNKQPFDTKCCWECGARLDVPDINDVKLSETPTGLESEEVTE